MEKSRTKNSFLNGVIGSGSQIISTILNFIVRTIFIYSLSNEYLGINGLFTNILMVLNFAELGFGSAIVYHLYKPVAFDDKEKIKSFVKFYKKVYLVIGLIVFVLGILVIPLMPYLINGEVNIKESLVLIYLLFLAETLVTYFFGYKRSVLLVYEKNYVNNLSDLIFSIIKSIVQVFILIFTHNYILYLIVYVSSIVFSNIYITIYVNKKYPFLKDKKVKKLEQSEVKKIWDNVKSLVVFKVGTVVLKGTDNIMISMLIGITLVGIYSNYSLVISAISGVMWTFLTGFTGSVGNLNANSRKEKKEEVFNKVLFVSVLLYGFACVCLGNLLSLFIVVWIGEDYLLDDITVLFLMITLYLNGLNFPQNVYRDTLGLFKEGKLVPLISAILNIALSILLGLLMGIQGIFLATILSILATTFWYMPSVIYKKIFDKDIWAYFKKVGIFTLPFIISYIVIYLVLSLIPGTSILYFILKVIITLIIFSVISILMLRNTDEYKEIKVKILSMLKERRFKYE